MIFYEKLAEKKQEQRGAGTYIVPAVGGVLGAGVAELAQRPQSISKLLYKHIDIEKRDAGRKDIERAVRNLHLLTHAGGWEEYADDKYRNTYVANPAMGRAGGSAVYIDDLTHDEMKEMKKRLLTDRNIPELYSDRQATLTRDQLNQLDKDVYEYTRSGSEVDMSPRVREFEDAYSALDDANRRTNTWRRRGLYGLGALGGAYGAHKLYQRYRGRKERASQAY